MSHPQASKATVPKLLHKGKSIGLNVLRLVCDMEDRPLLKALGFETTRGSIVHCIRNPADPTKELYYTPDMVHVFKPIKEMLANNREIELPRDVVEEFQLPSPKVQHIEKLCEFQVEGQKVASAPVTQRRSLRPLQRDKVAPVTHVLSDKTKAALQFRSEDEREIPGEKHDNSIVLHAVAAVVQYCAISEEETCPGKSKPRVNLQRLVPYHQLLLQKQLRLNERISSLMERAVLFNKVVSRDQLVAVKLGSHRGVKWTTESIHC